MQTVTNQALSGNLSYQNATIMTYKINYPKFHSTCSARAASDISYYYAAIAKSIEHHCKTTLYQEAVKQYEYNQAHNYPVMVYEVVVDFKITYNSHCITSLYSDYYTFTGGAHGNTVRSSETWNFQNGKQLSLIDLFPPGTNPTQIILNKVNDQIAENIRDNPSAYFEDYKELTKSTFQPNSFYLTPDGVMVYFQQYDIAPYSSGILSFLIKFQTPS